MHTFLSQYKIYISLKYFWRQTLILLGQSSRSQYLHRIDIFNKCSFENTNTKSIFVVNTAKKWLLVQTCLSMLETPFRKTTNLKLEAFSLLESMIHSWRSTKPKNCNMRMLPFLLYISQTRAQMLGECITGNYVRLSSSLEELLLKKIKYMIYVHTCLM